MNKYLLLPALFAGSLFLTACETTVVTRRPYHHPTVVKREVYYTGPSTRRYNRAPVVVSTYRRDPAPRVVYYTDRRGKYYVRDGRRVYVRVGY